MNYYQPQRMLSDLLPQDEEGLARLLYMNEEPQQDQRPMMLAQNTKNPNQLQRMIGVQGDGVSAQTKAGIEKALPGFYGKPEQAPVTPSYTPGTDAFSGGRTLRPGYERFGPMNDAEFKSLLEMRRKN